MNYHAALLPRTTLIALGLVAFLIGLSLARTKIGVDGWLVVASLVVLAASIIRFKLLLPLAAIAAGLTFGWWRGSGYLIQLTRYNDFYRHNITIAGTADSDAIYGTNSQLSFDLGHVRVVGQKRVDLVGKVAIKGFGEPMVYKGNQVRVTGKLYPTRGSRQASISFGTIKITRKTSSSIENIRRRFEAGMQSALPEPVASFGLGLLIGQRSTIPKIVSLELAAVGLTHVVAVSGYNLTIIMRGVRRLMKKRSKYQITLASLLLMGTFLLFTGFSASIVRAAIVSVLSLWAWYYGREFRPVVLILIAAAITAGFYPLYLWSDIGWYLSFLAFFGVMVIGPLISKRLYKRKEPKLVMSLIIETSSAQIMTMPIIMYIFGQFSAIALIANVLVVPLVPIGMLLCLVAGLGGMFLPMLAGWFAWPARVMLIYMLDVAAALSRLPRALIKQPLGLWQMIALYGMILFLVAVLWHKNRGKRDIIAAEQAGGRNVGSQQMVNYQAGEGNH